MRSLQRTARTVAAVVCAASVSAACTGGGDAAPVSNAAFERVGMDASRQAPAPEIEGAATGGKITVRTSFALIPTCLRVGGCQGSPLDPSTNYFLDSAAISTGLITRSLTQYVWDPESDDLVLVPDLATDLGRPNADYTQWTFTIRDGVRFEDGTTITAEDVKRGIERSMDRQTFPGGPSYGNDYFLHGDTYKGLYTGGSDYDGVVVDGQTLTIKMARPFPDMPYYGAFPEMGPIPPGAQAATYGLHPLATGPYKIKEFVPSKRMVLVRNDEWDAETDPGRHQYPDEFDFHFGQRMGSVWPDLIADRAKTTLSYDDVPAQLIADAQRAAGDRLTQRATQCLLWASPDYRTIDDIRVRRALGYAWPYRQHIEAIGGIPGVTGVLASSVLPPGTRGRVDYSPLAAPAGTTDPARSRALLAEAGYRPGEYRIDLAHVSGGGSTGEIVAAALERGGFHPVVHGYSQKGYDRLQADPNAPVDIRLGGWCSDWPTGTSWIPPFFTRGGPANVGFFHEDAVDAEVARIRRLPLDQQDAAWGRLEEVIVKKYYPIIPEYYTETTQLHGSRIGGLHVDSLLGMPRFNDLYVIPARR